MRIRLTLTPLSYPANFPVNQHPVASFIYQTVATVAPDFASFLHNQGFAAAASHKHFKFFVYSLPKLPRYEFVGDAYRFAEGVVQFQISSPLPEFIEAFITGLSTQSQVRLHAQDYVVSEIEIIKSPEFTGEMRFAALSPLTVAIQPKDVANKHYIRVDDDRFAALVVSNLCEKYRVLLGAEVSESELEFSFDWDYIRGRGGPDRVSKLIAYKNLKIKSYLAPFWVRGNPELIALGWNCGFGSANSQGFGMAGL